MMIFKLEEITEKLRALARSNDPEIAHSDADDLLIEALRALGGDDVSDLIAAYGEVPKWFA